MMQILRSPRAQLEAWPGAARPPGEGTRWRAGGECAGVGVMAAAALGVLELVDHVVLQLHEGVLSQRLGEHLLRDGGG